MFCQAGRAVIAYGKGWRTTQGIKVDSVRRTVETVDLPASGQHDLLISVDDVTYLAAAERLARFMVEYQRQFGIRIEPNQTAAYGFWTIKFVPQHSGVLEIWEVKSESESHLFVPGANRTLRYWCQQEELCTRMGTTMSPPHASDRAAVSQGVLEGTLAVEGVRYPSNKPNSGWYLTTDLYDGDYRSMRVIHLEHLISARPELLPLIALPSGFRFEVRTKTQPDVWFDDEVASSETV